MERPVYVRRLPSGELVAVLASCTHQGCQPEPVGDRLACPCHGSEFAFDGTVLEGPAERPLTRYPVSIEGDDIVVRLDGGAA
jgi:cytochrome b6-f complex iron-sulfur subunit